MPKPSERVIELLDRNRAEVAADKPADGSLEAQLKDLYHQRQELQRALGTADSRAIIAMVRSLEQQLKDLYRLLEGRSDHLPPVALRSPPTGSGSEGPR